MTRPCDGCGVPYGAQRASSRFCSDNCRKRVARGSKKVRPPRRQVVSDRFCDTCNRHIGRYRMGDLPLATSRCQPCRRTNPTIKAVRVERRVPCACCGALRYRGKPAWDGLLMCKGCRVKHPNVHIQRIAKPCPQCGVDFVPRGLGVRGFSVTCSKRCAQHLRVGRAPGDDGYTHSGRRVVLELSRPGLSRARRDALLHRWVADGRLCTYCEALASSVDHVVPLHRGGTNYEGNLAPACRPCNSSKGRHLLTEWSGRDGSRLRRLRDAVRGQAS